MSSKDSNPALYLILHGLVHIFVFFSLSLESAEVLRLRNRDPLRVSVPLSAEFPRMRALSFVINMGTIEDIVILMESVIWSQGEIVATEPDLKGDEVKPFLIRDQGRMGRSQC